jgi:hypothetical protein
MLYSDLILRGVQWTIDGCSLHFDFWTLPLANYDVVIGMDWLEANSPMQVDWRNKWLAVPYDGQIRVLQGITPSLTQQMLLHIEALLVPDSNDSTPSQILAAIQ